MTIGCTTCGHLAERSLYARVSVTETLCRECWLSAGRPLPPPDTLSPRELHEHQEATRRRMLKRGGADRHVVRKGAS